jgi:hypothetical protein
MHGAKHMKNFAFPHEMAKINTVIARQHGSLNNLQILINQINIRNNFLMRV